MDVLITPITIAPHSKEYLIIDVTYISGQQGELGIGQCLLQLPCSQLHNVVHEIFSSILIDIRGTNVNSMASLQLTNLHIWEILGFYEICYIKLHSYLLPLVIPLLHSSTMYFVNLLEITNFNDKSLPVEDVPNKTTDACTIANMFLTMN